MYTAAQAYKNSRAANLMFAYELARRVQDSGVKVYAICPGRLFMFKNGSHYDHYRGLGHDPIITPRALHS